MSDVKSVGDSSKRTTHGGACQETLNGSITAMPERSTPRRSRIDGTYIRVDEYLLWYTYATVSNGYKVPYSLPMVNGVGYERCGGCHRDVLEMFELPAMGTTSACHHLCLDCSHDLIVRAHPGEGPREYCPKCGFPWIAASGRVFECMFGHAWNEEGKRCKRTGFVKGVCEKSPK